MTPAPLALRHRDARAPADGFWLPDADADALRRCLAHAAGPWPAVHAVAGGFLVARSDGRPVGALPVRRQGERLWLPCAADLSPAMFDDEADVLTRGGGLLVLPGGRLAAFDPGRPLRIADLIAVPAATEGGWEPLPEVSELPRTIELERVFPTLDASSLLGDVLDELGDDEADAPPKPPERKPGPKAAFGRALRQAGDALGVPPLSRLGRKLAGEPGPKGEPPTGDDALRELLRQFKAGETDKALRKALPLQPPDPKRPPPTSFVRGGRLGDRTPLFSLSRLLGSDRGASGPAWLTGEDLFDALREQYRKAAEQAIRDGDHRRAAYIYGELLGNVLTAANTLVQGGFHREAAVLFRDRLNLPHFAAQSFHRAGDLTEALRLFRQRNRHEEAGDVLRLMGREADAVAAYLEEAEARLRLSPDYAAVGTFVLRKTQRPDLAEGVFRRGWDARDRGLAHAAVAMACATRLLELSAAPGSAGPPIAMLNDVRDWLHPPGNEPESLAFHQTLARIADEPHFSGSREALRDRALLGLAHKLRQRRESGEPPGDAVGRAFGTGVVWANELVADAEFALRGKAAPVPPAKPGVTWVRPDRGKFVRAVRSAGALALATERGEVLVYAAATRELRVVRVAPDEVLGMAVSDDGGILVVLGSLLIRGDEAAERQRLTCYTLSEGGILADSGALELGPVVGRVSANRRLLPTCEVTSVGPQCRLVMPDGVSRYTLPRFVADRNPVPTPEKIRSLLWGGTVRGRDGRWGELLVGRLGLFFAGADFRTPPVRSVCPTQPAAGIVDFAAVTHEGRVLFGHCDIESDEAGVRLFRYPGPPVAAACLGRGRAVFAARAGELLRLRPKGDNLEPFAPPITWDGGSKPLECLYCAHTSEGVIALDSGEIVRVPVGG